MKALISVSNKKNIIPFAKGLSELGIEIISTGGTAKALKESGIAITAIDEVTHFPEMLDGRVKTLHPKIHGGILALRDNEHHMKTCQEHEIGMIDMVVVNLYPFEETIQKPNVQLADAIENIDIGGPSMIRSAAKNHQDVSVIVNPDRYEVLLAELKKGQGRLTQQTRQELAVEAFQHTARYDAIIANYLGQKTGEKSGEFPELITPVLSKVTQLRYGENPHQKAAFYQLQGEKGVPEFTQIHGKELSYNNIVDLEAAALIVREFDQPSAAIIKHTNPCGAALGETLASAYQRAHDADPVSAFGSIVGLNQSVDLETATLISNTFVEVVVAPQFDDDAVQLLSQKPSIRLIQLNHLKKMGNSMFFRYVDGGFLLQTPDIQSSNEDSNVVTQSPPSQGQMSDLQFAFKVIKYVKSNAIVVVKDLQVVGVGAGQMSRVEAVEIALKKAGEKSSGAVLASDAFFPFDDSVKLAGAAGIQSIIQPGGSKRDQDSIDCCNDLGVSMVFTGVRHFRH